MENSAVSDMAKSLEILWDKHCDLEFVTKDADRTVDETMVEEPYVNHIPTLTGGRGKAQLKEFYRNHFIPKLPDDTRTETISRTIGESRLVEELIFSCTHDREIDFLLPGVKATGKRLELPTIAVVTFEDGLIASEHIYWDQASALVQIGLLDSESLPVASYEVAHKVKDKTLPFRKLG